jgi:predicted metal-dependent HD superfamily phosphohydrolase
LLAYLNQPNAAMTQLEKEARDYVMDRIPAPDETALYYHDIHHTKQVVKTAREMGDASGLTDRQLELLTVAAWFHDLGYLNDRAHYAEASAAEARQFLQARNVPDKRIAKVEAAIRATQTNTPQTLLDELLIDADRAYLAGDSLMADLEHRRKEHNHFAHAGETLEQEPWWQQALTEMRQQRYFTDYGQRHFAALLQKNIEKLERKITKLHREDTLQQQVESLRNDLTHEREKAAKPLRGAETLFRTTSHNHLELSKIADSKAHLMIQVNSIIISLVVSVLLRRLEEYPNLIVPTALLMGVSLATIVYSILATRPHVTTGTFTTEEITENRSNLLYFGNFYRMPAEQFEAGLNMILADNQLLYGSMTRDLYALGQVLGHKYQHIRIAYNIFMFGMIASVVGFAIAMLFFPTA